MRVNERVVTFQISSMFLDIFSIDRYICFDPIVTFVLIQFIVGLKFLSPNLKSQCYYRVVADSAQVLSQGQPLMDDADLLEELEAIEAEDFEYQGFVFYYTFGYQKDP